MSELICSVCGNAEFVETAVLWPELVSEWQLSEAEKNYIDRQQGCACTVCGANLRIVALAAAIRHIVDWPGSLRDLIAEGRLDGWQILDCNGAGAVSEALANLPGYKRADFPEYDLHRLPFADGAFDLIIHSDTLEHVEHPTVALQECRRLLSRVGRLCFTVPVVIGRMSRSRAGLPLSYHGDPNATRQDFVVHTEFGADVWETVFEAGFTNVAINQVEYPSGIAITATDFAASAAAPLRESPIETASEVPPAELDPQPHPGIYDQDGLRSVHNHEFMCDPGFQAAYARGVQAAGADYNWHWRVHVGLWAASIAAKVPGDFIEFGVNRGFLSSAIMQLLSWNAQDRTFYLLDTFAGIDERYVNDDDRAIGVIERNQRDIDTGFYTFDLDAVRRNFSEWPRARIIAGTVPETLPLVDSDTFAFAHLDMNCAPPEIAAAEFVWPRMSPGGVILLDDYAYSGYRSQKLAMDEFARRREIPILSLPTGQGMMVKPA